MQPRLYLVSYDVASPKRWRRVYRLLRKRAVWLQLSAFACRLTPSAFAALERDLLKLIDPEADRLMIADLGAEADIDSRLRRHGETAPLFDVRARIL